MTLTPFLTLLEREIKRFMKVIVQTVITPFVSSFLYLLIFGVGLGSTMPSSSTHSYLAFLIPGLMMMSLINNAFQNSSSSIVNAKFSGDLEDMRVAPLTENQILAALSAGALVRGLVVGVVTLIVGLVFHFFSQGSLLQVEHPLHLVMFVIIAGLSFGLIGLSVAFWAKSFDQLSAFSAFVLLPLTYLGGVFLSITHLSPFWQSVARLNPLLYLINGARYGILGSSDVSIELAYLVSLLGLVVFAVVAKWSIKKGSFARW
jgi:ABC-2 type transport system permease protein